jgi:hypothetical protein
MKRFFAILFIICFVAGIRVWEENPFSTTQFIILRVKRRRFWLWLIIHQAILTPKKLGWQWIILKSFGKTKRTNFAFLRIMKRLKALMKA